MSFTFDGSSLAGTKSDARPLSGPLAQHLTAAELNAIVQAIYDLRTDFLGLAFDPRAYGAAANGVTDDTDALQDALDAANAAGGGVVRLPAGTCIVSAPLLVGHNVRIIGHGMGKSWLKHAAGFNGEILTNRNGGGDTRVGFASFAIYGNKASCPTSKGIEGLWFIAN